MLIKKSITQKNLILGPEYNDTFLKNFIKNIPSGVALFDKNLNYIIATDKFYEVSNLSESSILGKHMYEVVPDMPQKWRDIHSRCLQGEHIKCDEDDFQRENGEIEWWKWQVIPWYHENGLQGGMVLFVENITCQKQLEKDLKDTVNFLNESNKSLLKFSRACAHDLNSPLRSISNYATFTKDYVKKKYDQEDITLNDYLSKITESASYMSALILKLVDYASLKRRSIKKEWFSANDIMDSILDSMQSDIYLKNVEFTIKNLPHIYADKVLITQVFQNLIANSLKYNAEGQVLITIHADENEDFWILSVADNGIGIDPINHHKIFEDSVQVSKTFSCGGSGMGLNQCRKIIKDHGGEIWIKSELNQGSTFFFTIKK